MSPHPHQTSPPSARPLRRTAAMSLALIAVASMIVPAASAQGCEEDGKNMQCNEFGVIAMENQRDIKGKPIIVDVETTIYDAQADRGARYVMFSVRHEPRGASSPISMELVEFKSEYGDVVTMRVEKEVPNEINVWVHVIDVPTNTPITMQVKVGSTERGAFQLEGLVMPFDRGYEPVTSASGGDMSLFAYTLLGVNGATGKVGSGGSFLDGVRTPGFAVVPALGVVLLVAALAARRRSS